MGPAASKSKITNSQYNGAYSMKQLYENRFIKTTVLIRESICESQTLLFH